MKKDEKRINLELTDSNILFSSSVKSFVKFISQKITKNIS